MRDALHSQSAHQFGLRQGGLIRRRIESGSGRDIAFVRDAPGLSVCGTGQAPPPGAVVGL